MLRQVALIFGLLCLTTSASAQIEQGSFKFGIDTSLFRYSALTIESPDGSAEQTTSGLAFGPSEGVDTVSPLPGHVGLVLGYVVHPVVVPQLHLSFGRTSTETKIEADGRSDSADGPSYGTLMLRPEVEINFLPDASVVPFGLAGFDFRHTKRDPNDRDDPKVVLNGYGPVVGLGLHMFAVPKASIDLSAQFSYLVLNREADGEDLEGDASSLTVGLFAGVTVWP